MQPRVAGFRIHECHGSFFLNAYSKKPAKATMIARRRTDLTVMPEFSWRFLLRAGFLNRDGADSGKIARRRGTRVDHDPHKWCDNIRRWGRSRRILPNCLLNGDTATR